MRYFDLDVLHVLLLARWLSLAVVQAPSRRQALNEFPPFAAPVAFQTPIIGELDPTGRWLGPATRRARRQCSSTRRRVRCRPLAGALGLGLGTALVLDEREGVL